MKSMRARSAPAFSSNASRTLADIGIADAQQHAFEPRDGGDECGAGGFDVGETLGPVGVGVRPGEQHACLRFPLRGQAEGVDSSYCGVDGRFGRRVLTPISVGVARWATLLIT